MSSDPFCQDSSATGMSCVADNLEELSVKSDYKTKTGTSIDGGVASFQGVQKLKFLVLSVILVSATISSLISYRLVKEEVQDDFSSEYNGAVKGLAELSAKNLESVFHQIQSLSYTVMSSARVRDTEWPGFTLPDFESIGQSFLSQTGAVLVSFAPLVLGNEKDAWETYAVQNQGWIQESLQEMDTNQHNLLSPISPEIHLGGYDLGNTKSSSSTSMALPLWQISPAPQDPAIINFDLMSHPSIQKLVEYTMDSRQAILSEALDPSTLFGSSPLFDKTSNTPDNDGQGQQQQQQQQQPFSVLLQPVFSNFEETEVVGYLLAVIPWHVFFQGLLGTNGRTAVDCIVHDSSGQSFTYSIDAPAIYYVGPGDFHDESYDSMEERIIFTSEETSGGHKEDEHHRHELCFYPNAIMEDHFTTDMLVKFMTVLLSLFFVIVSAFLLYDFVLTREQQKIMADAAHHDAIVASLFPKNIRDQLFRNRDNANGSGGADNKNSSMESDFGAKRRLSTFLKDKTYYGMTALSSKSNSSANKDGGEKGEDVSRPIADFFPKTTVMFADIAGFTAWSSIREPSQVFTLLETVYSAFDHIANQRGVFKVETIGDCYVAVVGLPEPRDDHAIVMTRFARDILHKFNEMAKKLELSLGPDTGDLAMRIGLHSGPVTAGVLRGERARFQLFGDTVNTAARIESTGSANHVHLSQQTADLIQEGGKGHWIKSRGQKVVAKGKGELETYWLLLQPENFKNKVFDTTMSSGRMTSSSSGELTAAGGSKEGGGGSGAASIRNNNHNLRGVAALTLNRTVSPKLQRLISWNCEVLIQLLKQIVTKRNMATKTTLLKPPRSELKNNTVTSLEAEFGKTAGVMDELADVITLPQFDAKITLKSTDHRRIKLDPVVEDQLRSYVTVIASFYQDNPFHNFEHASHVTMSTVKLLSRIVAPDHIDGDSKKAASELHDHTYGITSDPLTQFSVVLSALVHDVDHRGVPNFLLIEEEKDLASIYNKKSVAEQNSVELAWEALMDPSFEALRKCIYTNPAELKRFRQLLVNSVLATDIFDKELSTLRKKRWQKAFSEALSVEQDSAASSTPQHGQQEEDVNRKATIVIEHLIQASDVAHTMQHWHVYQKWNERFFEENYAAYQSGRSDKDPSLNWYEGEIGFFDNYVIPLAKKLKNCGVFGVSSDEYLTYATENRREWASKGQGIVANFVKKYGSSGEETTAPTAPVPTAVVTTNKNVLT